MTPGPVLGMDTSGPEGSVALLGAGHDTEETFTEGMVRGIALAPAVARLLERAAIRPSDLALVAVGTGPGSHTGVRVGITFAKALAFAAGVPLAGVPSLDAMALAAAHDGPVACVLDARRDRLHLAVYRPGPDGPAREGEIRLVPPWEAAAAIPPGALVVGDAIDRFAPFLSGEGRILGDRARWRCPASAVARLGERALAEGRTVSPHDLSPVCLRPTEAEEQWDRRREES